MHVSGAVGVASEPSDGRVQSSKHSHTLGCFRRSTSTHKLIDPCARSLVAQLNIAESPGYFWTCPTPTLAQVALLRPRQSNYTPRTAGVGLTVEVCLGVGWVGLGLAGLIWTA